MVTFVLPAVTKMQNPNIENDASLLAQLRGRRTASAAINHLYTAYADDVRNLVVQLGGNSADGSDVFQDVVLAFVLLVQEDRFRGEASIRTMLHAMARRQWYNELRRRGRADARVEQFEWGREQLANNAAAALEHKEATATLDTVLGALGEGCHKLLTGFYYHQKPMQELAGELALGSEQVARNKKHRCLRKLSDLLENAPALKAQLKMLWHGLE